MIWYDLIGRNFYIYSMYCVLYSKVASFEKTFSLKLTKRPPPTNTDEFITVNMLTCCTSKKVYVNYCILTKHLYVHQHLYFQDLQITLLAGHMHTVAQCTWGNGTCLLQVMILRIYKKNWSLSETLPILIMAGRARVLWALIHIIRITIRATAIISQLLITIPADCLQAYSSNCGQVAFKK